MYIWWMRECDEPVLWQAMAWTDLYLYASLGFLYTLSHSFTYPCCLFLFSTIFSVCKHTCIHMFAYRYICFCMWRTDVAVQYLLFHTHVLKGLLMNSDLTSPALRSTCVPGIQTQNLMLARTHSVISIWWYEISFCIWIYIWQIKYSIIYPIFEI